MLVTFQEEDNCHNIHVDSRSLFLVDEFNCGEYRKVYVNIGGVSTCYSISTSEWRKLISQLEVEGRSQK